MHDTPGRLKLFSDVIPLLASDGAGETHINCRHALELWDGTGTRPYATAQDFGSCVDASCSEHETTLFGWRAAHPEALQVRGDKPEVFKYSAAWYKYANRGYCSDGWTGSGIATVARRVGAAFRINYELSGNTADFRDDDANERIVARQWCRSGIPDWLREYTVANHSYADGAITRFEGGISEIRRLCANGGVLHTSGTRTSGGSKPFTIGSTGPHMQSLVGMDDSDQFRQFCRDKLNVSPRDNDFPVVMHQTWGSGWRGECADEYWPDWWGPKPQGAWVWWASDIADRLSIDYAWLPWIKGFASEGPTPPTPGPNIGGDIYAEQVADRIAIRGELEVQGTRYIVVPKPLVSGVYHVIQKPVV
jgi:hypothetical protein